MKRSMFVLMAIAAVALAGCGKDDKNNSIRLASSNKTMYYDDLFQIEASSQLPLSYVSQNEYHAHVSASGLVTAGRIGQTDILVVNGEESKKVRITVEPQSLLYPEPVLTFGMSRSAVRAIYGTPDYVSDDAIGYYEYPGDADVILCMFDAYDRMSSYVLTVSTDLGEELINTFLMERYVYYGMDQQNYAIYYVNGLYEDTVTMGVVAELLDQYNWMVGYMPLDLTRGSSHDNERSAMIEEIGKMTKTR